MKYYARVFVTIYLILLTVILLWWKQSNVTVQLETYEQPIKLYRRYKADDKRVLKRDVMLLQEVAMEKQDFLRNRHPYISFLIDDRVRQCGGHFTGYKNLFAKLVNVLVDPRFARGKHGGENMSKVMNQAEEEEFYTLEKGFFNLPCTQQVKYEFGVDSHLNKWIETIELSTDFPNHYEAPQWTIAVQRYEYVNMYHTMTDWYNTFLVTKVFKLDPKNVTILWIDGHPAGGLDATWSTLFGDIRRIGEIRTPVLFPNMIWGIVGYDSPLDEHYLPEVAYLEEFRNFFLSKHNIVPEDFPNCNQLNILIIWRRDYVAHPRNPTGSVVRKIQNEDKLLKKIKSYFNGHNVKGLQIDKLSMQDQLAIISKTDILIGMHGAGLSHTLFLPRHSGLIELFPLYHPAENIHFKSMAEWRHMHYMSWSNFNAENELDNYLTVVNVDEIALLAIGMKNKICNANESFR
ncbi:uncharacterized protein LOC132733378 [Ruditapes philippinarum]|uniref:uncharacterized protein LOC132733378 n=1 Tax=Ruditapes philippinarum TaxID=129788 RepID=UPI00295B7E75|nr:uncharacterized protein LOC132733378 [Ruditapes philippinarum]